MTIAETSTFNLDLEGMCRVAMRKAGIIGPDERPSPEDVQTLAEMLNVELKSWQAAGRFLRQVERTTVALVAGTGSYVFAADTLDVEFPAFLTMTTSSTNTYVVGRMTLAEYMMISNKSETGIPSRALIERKDTVNLTVWPVPDATVASITVIRTRFIRDALPGTNPEVHVRYLKAALQFLAVEAGEMWGKDDGKMARLEARAERAMKAVKSDNIERGDLKFRL